MVSFYVVRLITLVNVMVRNKDLILDITWHNFATSHGKSARECSHKVISQAYKITEDNNKPHPPEEDLCEYAKASLQAVNILWNDDEQIDYATQHSHECYTIACSVGVSRSHHCFKSEGDHLNNKKTYSGGVWLTVQYDDINLIPHHSSQHVCHETRRLHIFIYLTKTGMWGLC